MYGCPSVVPNSGVHVHNDCSWIHIEACRSQYDVWGWAEATNLFLLLYSLRGVLSEVPRAKPGLKVAPWQQGLVPGYLRIMKVLQILHVVSAENT